MFSVISVFYDCVSETEIERDLFHETLNHRRTSRATRGTLKCHSEIMIFYKIIHVAEEFTFCFLQHKHLSVILLCLVFFFFVLLNMQNCLHPEAESTF